MGIVIPVDGGHGVGANWLMTSWAPAAAIHMLLFGGFIIFDGKMMLEVPCVYAALVSTTGVTAAKEGSCF
jgi:hypothetical protein